MPICTDQLQFDPMQFVGTSLTAFVGPQLYNCGMLPTTNKLLPGVAFVVIWNVTGTSAGPGNARGAPSINAAQTTHPASGILTIPADKNLLFVALRQGWIKTWAPVKEATGGALFRSRSRDSNWAPDWEHSTMCSQDL
jgi:hypothetical protein